MRRVLTAHTACAPRRGSAGFTLTEMLVTTLILVLASTLMATGIPVAIRSYRSTVDAANAQVALSTTVTVLRSELGTAGEVQVSPDGSKVFYYTDEGLCACIQNPAGSTRGLEKCYLEGTPDLADAAGLDAVTPMADYTYPLVADAAITAGLTVRVDSYALTAHTLEVRNLRVEDAQGNVLAAVGTDGEPYRVLLRFTQTD